MGLDFKLKDFAYPLDILRLKAVFERNQWLGEELLYEYQNSRLRGVIDFAYRHVPYYRNIFKKRGILPEDIKGIADLKILPFLDKETLRISFDELKADNFGKFNPQLLSTSGTTGGRIGFYVDKPSNIMEFVYYWRLWGWAGYRLGDTFAELSAQSFTPYNDNNRKFFYFEPVTRRLMVNSLLISVKGAEEYRRIFRKFRPKFLKGLPSNLYMLALIFEKQNNHGICFKAVFAQGENLLRHQRDLIAKVFQTKVFDCYGHMERTVAISQCPAGSYHLHSDYGAAELIPTNFSHPFIGNDANFAREIVGTSLHNFSMPLIRYRTGDIALVSNASEKCFCARGFPKIISILGRDSDVILTPDRRAITALYVALDRTPGLTFGQIIQESLDRLIVRVAYDDRIPDTRDSVLLNNIREFVGDSMKIAIEHVIVDDLAKNQDKFKVVISRLKPEDCFLN